MEKAYCGLVPKLSAATFAMRVVQPFLSLDSLKLIYFSYFHSILTYGIIFWGNTPSVTLFSECKRKLLGSWWEYEIEIPVESTLRD